MNNAEAILTIENLYKHFPVNGGTVEVLHDINFSFRAGEFVTIVGGLISARAIAHRWAIPPESWPGYALANLSRPTSFRYSGTMSGACLRSSSPNATFSSTVSHGISRAS